MVHHVKLLQACSAEAALRIDLRTAPDPEPHTKESHF